MGLPFQGNQTTVVWNRLRAGGLEGAISPLFYEVFPYTFPPQRNKLTGNGPSHFKDIRAPQNSLFYEKSSAHSTLVV